MKVEIEWITELPLSNNFEEFVLVTLYDHKTNEFWVDCAFIDRKGVFRTFKNSPLHYPVAAWAKYPKEFKTNPL